jgi:hypothetical protein
MGVGVVVGTVASTAASGVGEVEFPVLQAAGRIEVPAASAAKRRTRRRLYLRVE